MIPLLPVAPCWRTSCQSLRYMHVFHAAATPLTTSAADARFTASRFTASRGGGPQLELAGQHRQRRLVLTAASQLTALLLSSSFSTQLAPPACASLTSAAANGLPLLGRFEPLKGAASFIGTWQLGGPESAGPRGVLSLLRRTRTPD